MISVVVPVYNCRRYLGEAIESVFAQTHNDFELIVVDDGSDDGSGDVAREYEPHLRYVRQEHLGQGAARNHGVSLARGEFLAFLDADDRFVAPKLERQLEELQAHPNLDLVYALVREFVSPELPPGAREGMRPPAPAPAAFHCPGAMLVRRPSFDRVGPFSNDLQVGETVDWCLRAVELALETHVVPEVLLERRLHTQNTGLRARASSADYARALKASLDRRRAEAAPGE